MKILIPVFEIQDYGGITGHTELLMRGLKEAGHTVKLVILRNNTRGHYLKKFDGPAGSYPSQCGGNVHLLAGWYGVPVISYGNRACADGFVRFAQDFDYIIWDLPCPYDDEGEWQRLYESGVPQVAVIHDAHYRRAYRHLDDVADKLKFIAPVNESAFGAVSIFPGKVRLINNGHKLENWEEQRIYATRQKIAVCAHVWKAWKNMHRVVQAAPLVRNSYIIMGGDGIEGRYMRSPDKCKPKYKGMWTAYCASPHEYVGVLTPDELFHFYANARVMIDLSWNDRFASYGCHYNRSIVEGANWGCIPLVNKEFFAGSKVFPEGTYIGVSKDAGPEELARWINMACSMRQEEADEIIGKLRRIIIDQFDYKRTSLQYLEP